jgi:MprA protease rhombosortase-interaction domain-containing protein
VAAFSLCSLGFSNAEAQEIFSATVTLGGEPAPIVRAFTIAQDADHTITLVDTGDPVAGPPLLSRLHMAIVREGTLVTRFDASDSQTLPLVSGDYTLRLIGVPDAQARVGAAAVSIVASGTSVSALDLATTFELPPLNPTGLITYQRTFDISAAGNYRLTVDDFELPTALTSMGAVLFRLDDFSVVPAQSANGTLVFAITQPGTYELTTSAQPGGTDDRGLYGIQLQDTTTGSLAFGEVRELGVWPEPASLDLNAAAYQLSVTDFSFPVPLQSLEAVVIANGALVSRSATGSVAFNAAAATHSVYIDAVAQDPPGAGTYFVEIADVMGTAVWSIVDTVEPHDPRNDLLVLDTRFEIVDAGDYLLELEDFSFPAPLVAVSAILTADGGVVGSLNAEGSLPFTGSAAQYQIAVVAESAQASASGLAAIVVSGGPSNSTVFERTVAVGARLVSAPVDIATAGQYRAVLSDLAFPMALQELSIAVSRGTELVGSIFGGGTLPIAATPGRYQVSLLARPDPTGLFGTFDARVSVAQPPPTVTLTANVASVAPGGSVTLQWSASDAADCTASGEWSGARATVGSETIGNLQRVSTFALNCQGGGGSARAEAVVTVVASTRSGGGGAIDPWSAMLLAVVAIYALRRRVSGTAT